MVEGVAPYAVAIVKFVRRVAKRRHARRTVRADLGDRRLHENIKELGKWMLPYAKEGGSLRHRKQEQHVSLRQPAVARRKRVRPGEHGVKKHAQPVNIRALVGGFAAVPKRFRRRVERLRSQDRRRKREELGEANIQQFIHAGLPGVHQDPIRVQTKMPDSCRMRLLKRTGELPGGQEALRDGEAPLRGPEDAGQRLPLDREFGGDPIDARCHAAVVERGQVRIVQGAEPGDHCVKALPLLGRVVGRAAIKAMEPHEPIVLCVPREVVSDWPVAFVERLFDQIDGVEDIARRKQIGG
ncbi:MAG TPA: hypothetical protein VK459_01465 [Polyangiaceae bacterium]|nr:hypothetical protein [Polyangiaceae bacterium]